MANIIKNGSFDSGSYNYDGSEFIPSNWVVPNSSFSQRIVEVKKDGESNPVIQIMWANWNNEDTDYGYPDGLPPRSVQQGINLTSYTKEIVLEIKFDYALTPLYRFDRSEVERKLDVYLYEATSYDINEGTYTYEGPYLNYISKNTYNISKEDDSKIYWNTSRFVITNLQPGYYILVFATPIAKNSLTGNADASYNFLLDNVSGEAEYTERRVSGVFNNVTNNYAFETISNSAFADWYAHGVTVEIGNADDYGDDIYYNHGSYVCEASCDNLEYAKLHQYGLKQILYVDSYCKMTMGLNFQQYRDCHFALSVYKLLEYFEYDEEHPMPEGAELPFWYITDDEPCCQNNIESWNPSADGYSGWESFASETFAVEPGYYLLIIHPGEGKTIIDNVVAQASTDPTASNEGTFDNPYTSDDGYISYNNKYFFFYYPFTREEDTIPIENRTGFVFYNGNYYYCKSEILILDKIFNDRYYYPDGRMAISESIIYDGKVYIANELGYLTLETDYEPNICPYLDEEMTYGPINLLDIIEGTEEYLYVKLNYSISDITLDVFSSDSDRLFCSEPQIIGEKSFAVKLTGHRTGDASITVSIINPFDVVENKDIKVTILPSTLEYINPYSVFFHKNIVCSLPNQITKLDYTVLPKEEIDAAMFWWSTDPSIATVDQYGNVTAGSTTGSCCIMIYNHRLNMTCSCDFHVIRTAETPQEIRKLSFLPNTIQVGEEIRLPDYVLIESEDSYAIQDGYWTSDEPSILSISEHGTIIGNRIGEATVIFRTPRNPNLVDSVVITVVEAQVTIENIELDMYEATLNKPFTQESLKINHRVYPVNADKTEVIWSSSNTDLITVSSDGLIEVKNEVSNIETVTVRCTSILNPLIYKECVITLDPNKKYPHKVKTFTPKIKTTIEDSVYIEYAVVNCFSYDADVNFKYEVSVFMEDGSEAPDNSYLIRHTEGSLIRFIASVEGVYQIRLTCSFYKDGLDDTVIIYGTADFYVEVGESPEFKFLNNLETVSALATGRYILRFSVKNNVNSPLSFELNRGNGWIPVEVDDLIYQDTSYSYIFGEFLSKGSHMVKVRATRVNDGEYITSNVATITIPEFAAYNRKHALLGAKNDYDLAENDIISYLSTVISDNRLYDNEELEFTARYKVYCHNYYNLKTILKNCIDYINEEIAYDQTQMATLSSNLSSNGVIIASYSEDDCTSSNYQNVTNMDYYQNECIKQLVARVLVLEARLDELTNNNN